MTIHLIRLNRCSLIKQGYSDRSPSRARRRVNARYARTKLPCGPAGDSRRSRSLRLKQQIWALIGPAWNGRLGHRTTTAEKRDAWRFEHSRPGDCPNGREGWAATAPPADGPLPPRPSRCCRGATGGSYRLAEAVAQRECAILVAWACVYHHDPRVRCAAMRLTRYYVRRRASADARQPRGNGRRRSVDGVGGPPASAAGPAAGRHLAAGTRSTTASRCASGGIFLGHDAGVGRGMRRGRKTRNCVAVR